MKLKILLFIINSLFFCNSSFSQEAYYHLSVPDTAFFGIDVIYEDGFHILGNAWDFSPPYNDIPIEGEYSFGNVYFFLDEDGLIRHQVYFNNNEIAPTSEGHGRTPGTFFFPTESEEVILPYTKHQGIIQCDNPLQGRSTDRVGIIGIEKSNGQLVVKDTIYNQFGLCENKALLGGYSKNDGFLLALKDNFDESSLIFRFYDFQRNLISENTETFISFEARTNEVSVDRFGNLLFLGRDSTDEYNMALLKTSTYGDSLTKVNIYSSTHPFTPIALSSDENDNYLIAAYSYSLDYSEHEYFLFCYDTDLNEKWRKSFPNKINAIASLKGGQGHLIVHSPVLEESSSFSVGYVNNAGELLTSIEYGQENDIPRRIRIFNDSLFAVIGTKFIGYETSSVDNPYASIFLSVDTIQLFLLSDIAEQTIENTSKLKVYPNPSEGIVNVSISSEYKNIPKLVEIYNIAGVKLSSYIIDSGSNQLSLDSLPCGSYIGIIHFDKGIVKPFRFSIFR